jgi:hypothetical protein
MAHGDTGEFTEAIEGEKNMKINVNGLESGRSHGDLRVNLTRNECFSLLMAGAPVRVWRRLKGLALGGGLRAVFRRANNKITLLS